MIEQLESDVQLFDQFIEDISNASCSIRKIKSCDQDGAYFFELQNKRSERLGIQISCNVTPYENSKLAVGQFASDRYAAKRYVRFVNREISAVKDGRVLYKEKSDQEIYVTAIDDRDQHAIQMLRKRPHECPNCGAIQRTEDLLEGCKYCKTRYIMSDLYPVVTNHWFLRFDSLDTVLKNRKAFYRICRLAAFAGMFLYLSISPDITSVELSMKVIMSLLNAVLTGTIVGYLLSVIHMIVVGIRGNKGYKKSHMTKQRNRMVRELLKRDPSFSYDYFESKIISLVRMAILTDDIENLSAYEAKRRSPGFENIVDVMYEGYPTVFRYSVKDGQIEAAIRIYLMDLVYEGNTVFRRGDAVDVVVARDLHREPDPAFSMHMVSCTACGGSFDASHQRKCPFCRNEYQMRKDDWVIREMALLKGKKAG